MENSVDEWINILLEAKRLAAKLAQGDIDLNEYRKSISYDFGEILKNILSIKNED